MIWLALVHLVCAGVMAGVVWFVQVVQYPAFGLVGPAEFPSFHAAHTARIGRVVVPAMLLEAACAAALVALDPGILTLCSLFLLMSIWVSTFAVQVPLHRRLAAGPDGETVRRLVATNWVRTLAWSARVAVAAGIVVRTTLPEFA